MCNKNRRSKMKKPFLFLLPVLLLTSCTSSSKLDLDKVGQFEDFDAGEYLTEKERSEFLKNFTEENKKINHVDAKRYDFSLGDYYAGLDEIETETESKVDFYTNAYVSEESKVTRNNYAGIKTVTNTKVNNTVWLYGEKGFETSLQKTVDSYYGDEPTYHVNPLANGEETFGILISSYLSYFVHGNINNISTNLAKGITYISTAYNYSYSKKGDEYYIVSNYVDVDCNPIVEDGIQKEWNSSEIRQLLIRVDKNYHIIETTSYLKYDSNYNYGGVWYDDVVTFSLSKYVAHFTYGEVTSLDTSSLNNEIKDKPIILNEKATIKFGYTGSGLSDVSSVDLEDTSFDHSYYDYNNLSDCEIKHTFDMPKAGVGYYPVFLDNFEITVSYLFNGEIKSAKGTLSLKSDFGFATAGVLTSGNTKDGKSAYRYALSNYADLSIRYILRIQDGILRYFSPSSSFVISQ